MKLSCKFQLANITIPSEYVEKIFNVNDKNLCVDSYQNTICEILKAIYGCSFNVKDSKKKAKTIISIYVYCIMDNQKVYCVKIYKKDIKKSMSIECEVFTNKEAVCVHDESDIRYLSKDKRKEIKNTLIDSTVTKVRTMKMKI